MLAVKNLQFSYSKKKSFMFPDFSCERGETLLILGPSGCGKTTLLHLLGGMLKGPKGSVVIDETDLFALKTSAQDRFRGQNIGIVFQKSHFVSSMSLKRNLLLAQFFAGIKQDTERIKKVLAVLQIESKLNKIPSKLSEGEKQRAAMARALLNEPKILLADEPTASLDDNNCEELVRLLKEQADHHNSTLIIVTHDQRLKDKFSNQLILT